MVPGALRYARAAARAPGGVYTTLAVDAPSHHLGILLGIIHRTRLIHSERGLFHIYCILDVCLSSPGAGHQPPHRSTARRHRDVARDDSWAARKRHEPQGKYMAGGYVDIYIYI